MRSARVFAVAAGLLLVGTSGPALAGSPVPAPAPPPRPLEKLRADMGHHPVRLQIGQDRYEIRHVRLESAGVAFDPRDLLALPSRATGGPYYAEKRGSPLASPIGWDRIDRIETRQPSALRGAIWGMVALPVVALGVVAAIGDWDNFTYDADGLYEPVIIGGGAVIGMLVGTGIGAFVHHSKRVWRRPPSAPGATR
jgi:hypothetical protein